MTTLPGADSLKVGTRRRVVDLWWLPSVVMYAVVLALLVALGVFCAVHGVWVMVVTMGLLGLLQLVVLTTMVRAWLSIRRVTTPLEIGPAGLVARTVHGEVVAPWEAVSAVSIDKRALGQVLRVRCTPPVFESLSGRRNRATARRDGLTYAMRVLDVDAATLAGRVRSLSGGRLQP